MIARGLIFLIAATVTSVFFINFCATIFQCGCQSLWGAADRFCNIHAAHGKHCPWCSFGNAGHAFVYGSMLLAQAAASFGPWLHASLLRLAVALAAFPATGIVLALLLGWITQYWN